MNVHFFCFSQTSIHQPHTLLSRRMTGIRIFSSRHLAIVEKILNGPKPQTHMYLHEFKVFNSGKKLESLFSDM